MRMWIWCVCIYIGLHMFIVGVKWTITYKGILICENSSLYSCRKIWTHRSLQDTAGESYAARDISCNLCLDALNGIGATFHLPEPAISRIVARKDTSHNSMLALEWSATVSIISCLATYTTGRTCTTSIQSGNEKRPRLTQLPMQGQKYFRID